MTVKKGILQMMQYKFIPDLFISGSSINEDEPVEKNYITSEGELFRCFFENISDAAFLIDYEEMKIELVNSAALKLYGYSKDELLGINPLKISAESENTKAALRDHVSYIAERPHKKKSGEIFWVEANVTYFNSGGREKIILTVRDITQRKLWENEIKRYSETLETAIESARLGLWDWDIKKEQVNFNYLYSEIMEIDPGDNIRSISEVLEMIYPGDRKNLLRRIEEHFSGSTPFFVFEFKLNYADKTKRKWINSFGRIVERDDSGNPLRMLGFNRDITENKIAEEELLRAKLKAEESDRLKTAFLANMSHEIRTPLNAVAGFSRLLKRGDLDRETMGRYCEIIQSNSDQLIRLVSDILDLSKIESGTIEFENGEINLYQFLKEIYSLLEDLVHQNGKSNIKTGVKYPERNIVFISDENRLKQIMNNLLSNAVKFTSQGKITAGCEIINNTLNFYVSDSGIGIPEENRETIFDRFSQVDSSYTRNYSGTGLGLAISRKLARMMGGDLTVDSGKNRGSAFNFRISLVEAAIKSNLIEKDFPGRVEYTSGKTVLVADDIWHIHDFIKAVLDMRGYNIISVYNGKEALKVVCDNENIDLVFMDIQMPVMNGITAMSMLKEVRPNLPIVALTAHAMSGDRGKYLSEGFDDYLSKPVDLNQLFALLDNILEKKLNA